MIKKRIFLLKRAFLLKEASIFYQGPKNQAFWPLYKRYTGQAKNNTVHIESIPASSDNQQVKGDFKRAQSYATFLSHSFVATMQSALGGYAGIPWCNKVIPELTTEVEVSEVSHICDKLKLHKAPDPDMIFNEFLRYS